jgi:hypothetical protein
MVPVATLWYSGSSTPRTQKNDPTNHDKTFSGLHRRANEDIGHSCRILGGQGPPNMRRERLFIGLAGS